MFNVFSSFSFSSSSPFFSSFSFYFLCILVRWSFSNILILFSTFQVFIFFFTIWIFPKFYLSIFQFLNQFYYIFNFQGYFCYLLNVSYGAICISFFYSLWRYQLIHFNTIFLFLYPTLLSFFKIIFTAFFGVYLSFQRISSHVWWILISI